MKVFRMVGLSLAAILAAAGPASAQDATQMDPQAMDQAMAQMGEMFPVVPLTADEQQRLPAARAIVGRIMPEGTMGELMGSMFENIMGPMTQIATTDPKGAFLAVTGIEATSQNMTDEQVIEALTLLDPAWRERREAEAEIMPQVMTRLMTDMEPAMRAAMSEMYAVYFDETELADIDAFFATPSGATYARESFRMSSDPRMIGTMMQQMPTMMSGFMEMGEQMQQATAHLPQKRSWDTLDANDRARLSQLTGIDPEELSLMLSATD